MSEHALLLINLGSPKSSSVTDVRHYLNEFLMDPYVIDLPWPLRRLLVGLILWRRPAQSAHAYRSIWWPEGSPLIVISHRLQEQVKTFWHHGPVELAMRYGEPDIESVLSALSQQGVRRITAVPLYPQFADSTTTTVIDKIRQVVTRKSFGMDVSVLSPFYAQRGYQDALLASAKPYLQQEYDYLLMSFHGLPERHIRKLMTNKNHDLTAMSSHGVDDEAMAVCYRSQCIRTAELFARNAGLAAERWSFAFQSRLGRDKWIEPYSDVQLESLAVRGVKKLLVMCPSFVADCIETLEEIGIRGREQFLAAGGESLTLIPCLNDDSLWAEKLVEMCQHPALTSPLKR